jgi:hypothetical protein
LRILFDQGTPVPLRQYLADHFVATAFEMGWAELDNGSLLLRAEAQFDALVTTDQNLRYQQTLTNGTSQLSFCRLPVGRGCRNTIRRLSLQSKRFDPVTMSL